MQLGHTPAQLQECRLVDLEAMLDAADDIRAEQAEQRLADAYDDDEQGDE